MTKFIETVLLGFIIGCWIIVGIIVVFALIDRAMEWHEWRQAGDRETDALIDAFERAQGRFPQQSYGACVVS